MVRRIYSVGAPHSWNKDIAELNRVRFHGKIEVVDKAVNVEPQFAPQNKIEFPRVKRFVNLNRYAVDGNVRGQYVAMHLQRRAGVFRNARQRSIYREHPAPSVKFHDCCYGFPLVYEIKTEDIPGANHPWRQGYQCRRMRSGYYHPSAFAVDHVIRLGFDSQEGPHSSKYATQPNKHERNGGDSGDACETERPSLDVRCMIFFGLGIGGLSFGLYMALCIHNERDFRRAAFALLGGLCSATGVLFWFFTLLHPYTWGLPPQWLPEKWNPCPQDYRDYSLHGQIVTQKHLTSAAVLYYKKDMANVLAPEKQTAIIGSLCEGSSIRAIERMTGVHRDTVVRLGVRVGQGCTAMMSETLRDLNCTRLEMDEIWGFIGKKEKRVKPVDDPRTGDVWAFCAIDADSKLVPSFKVGKRTNATADAFVQDVASRMRNRVQISTDGLKAYVNAIEHSFGGDVDYAQIIKTYGQEEVSNNQIGRAHV